VRFWDSSAVVPLLALQKRSTEVEQWLTDDRHVAVWTLTPVEVTSALFRLVRDGALAHRDARAAEDLADILFKSCQIVTHVEVVKATARRLLRLHPLRAADALQLGAALEWAGHQPEGLLLHTFDGRLGRAAAREGFRVIPEPA
jgi:hypothetical protein